MIQEMMKLIWTEAAPLHWWNMDSDASSPCLIRLTVSQQR